MDDNAGDSSSRGPEYYRIIVVWINRGQMVGINRPGRVEMPWIYATVVDRGVQMNRLVSVAFRIYESLGKGIRYF